MGNQWIILVFTSEKFGHLLSRCASSGTYNQISHVGWCYSKNSEEVSHGLAFWILLMPFAWFPRFWLFEAIGWFRVLACFRSFWTRPVRCTLWELRLLLHLGLGPTRAVPCGFFGARLAVKYLRPSMQMGTQIQYAIFWGHRRVVLSCPVLWPLFVGRFG